MMDVNMLQRLIQRDRTGQPPLRPRAIAAALLPAIDVRYGARLRLGALRWSFLLFVLVPVAVITAYNCFIASNQYESEATFTVRTASENNSSLLSDAVSNVTASIGAGLGGSSNKQEIFAVADYIRSQSIIEDMGGKQRLYQAFAQSSTDYFSRLSPEASLEKGWKYWKHKVSALVDTPSGVVTLRVRAFSSEDAHALAEQILRRGEILVNAMSERSRRDALHRARDEISRAESRLKAAQQALLSYRNETETIDPVLSAKSLSETLLTLTRQRLLLENNRDTLRDSIDRNAPTLRVLNAQIDALDHQINSLKSALTSQVKSNPISAQIARYQDLEIESKFAEKLYSITQAAYEKARVEQEKQQLYLVIIERPTRPERAQYPQIILEGSTTFAGFLILWSMFALMVATVKDHLGG